MWSQAVLTWSCPLTECQQNQRDGCGFVEEAAEEVHTLQGSNGRGRWGVHITENLTCSMHTQTSWLYHLRQLSDAPKRFALWCCGKATGPGNWSAQDRSVVRSAERLLDLHSRLCWTTPELAGLWGILTTTALDCSSFYYKLLFIAHLSC